MFQTSLDLLVEKLVSWPSMYCTVLYCIHYVYHYHAFICINRQNNLHCLHAVGYFIIPTENGLGQPSLDSIHYSNGTKQ